VNSVSQVAESTSWRGPFRTLLMSRSLDKRKAALQQLQPMYEEVSSQLLAEVEGAGGKWWHRIHLRPLFGYQSACAALYRIMVSYVMPAQAGSQVKVQRRIEDGKQRVRYVLRDDVMDGEEEEQDATTQTDDLDTDAGRARALFVFLRQLVDAPAWQLERTASAEQKQQDAASPDKWLARTPDLETPEYTVVLRDPEGAFEVREYTPYSVVQMKEGCGGGNGTKSFFALAGYIFGKTNVQQEKMAMTTPVQVDSKSGLMSFIMPSKYWGDEAIQDAPAPQDDAGVQLIARPSESVAVTVFGGYARSQVVAQKTEMLLAALNDAENIEVVDPSQTRLMQYNDPFTVPWKRRNEVSVAVRIK